MTTLPIPRSTVEDTLAQAPRSFCAFWLGQNLFGIDVGAVREVSMVPPLTITPQAPPAVSGYVNLRGQIHLVLDARHLMGQPMAALTSSSRLILFKPSLGEAIGILVDQIGDMVRVESRHIETRADDVTSVRVACSGLVVGVGKLDVGLLIVLEPRRFLQVIEREFQERVSLAREATSDQEETATCAI